MEGGIETQQDGTQFEDALRRLHALEKKLAGQVLEDITELRQQWVQPRVDRVTNNTFKLYQVRVNLKQSKMLYVEEDQLLEEFGKVKQVLITNSMDEETFEAAKETCLVLGGKLGDVRHKQLMCYSDSRDLETNINKDIMTLRFENKDFEELDLNYVRCNTPHRELSPTPLERHKSREPSPFRMPPMKIGSGTTTPGGSLPADPHAYFSRPGSSQSMYGGRGGEKELDAFRAAMEAKQAEDDSPPKYRKQPSQFPTTLSKSTSGNIVIRSASGIIIGKSDGSDAVTGPLFDRPSSGMSDMSINIHDAGQMSRPGSRLGDDVSGIVDPFAPPPEHVSVYIDQEDTELNLETDQALKEQEEAEIKKRAAEQVALIQREAQEKFQEKEKIRLAKETVNKKAEEELKKEKLKQEKDLELKEREERRQADEQKMKDMAEKRRMEAEIKKEKEIKEQEEIKCKRLEEKQEKIRKAEETKLKKEEDERKKEEANKVKLEEKKKKMDAANEKKRLEAESKAQEKAIEDSSKITQLTLEGTEDALKDQTSIETVSQEAEKEIIMERYVKEENAAPTETPKLDKPKRRTSTSVTRDQTARTEDDNEEKKEEPIMSTETKLGSPISILKGGKGSRDASKDRAGNEEVLTEESVSDKPLSRKGSLKKSSSFTKRGLFAEKKKISFDEDVDIEKFEKEVSISTAKEIFAAIADTTLEAGTNILKQRSRDPSRERRDSKESGSGFPPAEPAEWYPPEGSEFDNEDELMIILDTDQQLPEYEDKQPLSVKSRSASKERPGSRSSQGSSSSAVSKPGFPELEIVDLPPSIKKMIDGMKGLEEGTTEKEDFDTVKTQDSTRARSASTGFSHLDEFERKLAEMEHDLENETKEANMGEEDKSFQEVAADFKETFQYQDEPIYATIAPKKDRQSSKALQTTEDGFFINKEEDLSYDQAYEADEDVGSEYSRNKKVSFAESDERFEFERQKKDTGIRSFTKFFSLGPPKPMKSLPGKEIQQEPAEQHVEQTASLAIPPAVPKRSHSKDRSQSLNNENATPKAFLTAMTGGLIDPNKNDVFGSLLRGRKSSRSGSRQSSRQSSGDRGSQDLWSDEEGRPSSRGSLDPYDGTSDVMSDSSLVNKLKKLKIRKPKKVQPEDFDELFARGMAISAQKESESTQDPKLSRRLRKRQTQEGRKGLAITVTSPVEGNAMVDENGTRFTPFEVYSQDKAFQTTQADAGIGYAEKVMSYLDDQAQAPVMEMTNGDTDGAHVSRGRKKHRQKAEKQAPLETKPESCSLSGNARSKSTEERKRSREYTKPEDIKLSPGPIRDLYTGEILSAGSQPVIRGRDASFARKDSQNAQHVVQPVASDPYNLKHEGETPMQYGRHTQGMAPSPGKSFLDAVNGQEVFGASIEGENPEITAKLAAVDLLSNAAYKDTSKPLLNNTTMNTNYDPSAKTSAQPIKSQVVSPPRPEEPADKGIPTQLVPDKLMANEEFYEQLRSGMKSIEAPAMQFEHTQEDPESYQKYSHHLGRAEFGTLKKRTSNRPSAAASRDPSGDRLHQQRPQTIGLSRDPSGDRLAVGTKISLQSSRDQMRSDSRFSNYSGGLPDLEMDDNIALPVGEENQPGVQRTVSLLVSGVDMDRPGETEGQKDMRARREEVLREIAQHKQEIREAKGWIQNGLMTVVGFGVMVYLQTLETAGL